VLFQRIVNIHCNRAIRNFLRHFTVLTQLWFQLNTMVAYLSLYLTSIRSRDCLENEYSTNWRSMLDNFFSSSLTLRNDKPWCLSLTRFNRLDYNVWLVVDRRMGTPGQASALLSLKNKRSLNLPQCQQRGEKSYITLTPGGRGDSGWRLPARRGGNRRGR
jgi:hypothetical protein